MALDFLTGLEHGIISESFPTVSGTPASATINMRSGTRCMRTNGTAAAPVWARRAPSTAHAVVSVCFSMYVDTHGANEGNFVIASPTGGTREMNVRLSASREVVMFFWDGTASQGVVNTGYILALDRHYWFQLKFDVTATLWKIDGRVRDDADVETTFTQASWTAPAVDTVGGVLFGAFGGLTADIYWDDFAMYRDAAADYPFSNRKYVMPYRPNGKGTHNITSAGIFLKDVAGAETAITDAGDTDSHTVIDDNPLDQDTNHIVMRELLGAEVPLWGAIVASTGANVTPVLPAHVTNDILIAVIGFRSTAVTCTTPTGWTLGATVDRTTAFRYYWFWKRATSAAETNPLLAKSAATGDTYAMAGRIRGAELTGNFFSSASAQAFDNTAGEAETFTGPTTTITNERVVVFGVMEDNLPASIPVTSTGQTWTADKFETSVTGTDGGVYGASTVKAVAGALGTITVDPSATAIGLCAFCVAVQPEVQPAAPVVTDYVEHSLADPVEGRVLEAVRGLAAMRNESTTLANVFAVKLRANAGDGNIFSGSIASAVTVYKTALFTTPPGGGTWTEAILAAATIRTGYSSDVVPEPRLEATMLEALFTTVATAGPAVIPEILKAPRIPVGWDTF